MRHYRESVYDEPYPNRPNRQPFRPNPQEHLMELQSAALGGLISDDWFDDLKDTLSDLGAKGLGLIDKVKKEFDDKGAAIITMTNYVGPGNRTDEAYQKSNPPKNIIDQTGLTHDLEYADIAKRRAAGEITKEQADEETRISDEKFLKSVQNNWKKDPWAAILGYAGIYSKVLAEDIGALDRSAFVTAKNGRVIKRRFGM